MRSIPESLWAVLSAIGVSSLILAMERITGRVMVGLGVRLAVEPR